MTAKVRVPLTFCVATLVGICFGALFAGAMVFVAHSKPSSELAQTSAAAIYVPASVNSSGK